MTQAVGDQSRWPLSNSPPSLMASSRQRPPTDNTIVWVRGAPIDMLGWDFNYQCRAWPAITSLSGLAVTTDGPAFGADAPIFLAVPQNEPDVGDLDEEKLLCIHGHWACNYLGRAVFLMSRIRGATLIRLFPHLQRQGRNWEVYNGLATATLATQVLGEVQVGSTASTRVAAGACRRSCQAFREEGTAAKSAWNSLTGRFSCHPCPLGQYAARSTGHHYRAFITP